MGDFQGAFEAFEETLRIKPDYFDAWYNKVVVLRRLGDFQEALEVYKETLTFKPDDPNSWYNKGVNLASLGRHN